MWPDLGSKPPTPGGQRTGDRSIKSTSAMCLGLLCLSHVSVLPVDLVFHPAALTLSSAHLVDVVGRRLGGSVGAGHVLIIVASAGVRSHDVGESAGVRGKFGDVAEGVRSLHGAVGRCCHHPWFCSAAFASGLSLLPARVSEHKRYIYSTSAPGTRTHENVLCARVFSTS